MCISSGYFLHENSIINWMPFYIAILPSEHWSFRCILHVDWRANSHFLHSPLHENSFNSEIRSWCPLTNNFFSRIRKKPLNSRMLTAWHMNNSRGKYPENSLHSVCKYLDPLVHLSFSYLTLHLQVCLFIWICVNFFMTLQW